MERLSKGDLFKNSLACEVLRRVLGSTAPWRCGSGIAYAVESIFIHFLRFKDLKYALLESHPDVKKCSKANEG